MRKKNQSVKFLIRTPFRILKKASKRSVAYEASESFIATYQSLSVFIFFLTEAKNLISSLLNVVPMNRPTLRQILNHPWFTMQGR